MYNDDELIDSKNIIELSEFVPNSGYPFAIAFVYAQSGNYIVKGISKEVEDYIKNNFGICHYNLSVWKSGKKLDCWKINNKRWRIIKDLQNGKNAYIFEYNKNQKFILSKIPKKFIGELLNLTPNQQNKVDI